MNFQLEGFLIILCSSCVYVNFQPKCILLLKELTAKGSFKEYFLAYICKRHLMLRLGEDYIDLINLYKWLNVKFIEKENSNIYPIER